MALAKADKAELLLQHWVLLFATLHTVLAGSSSCKQTHLLKGRLLAPSQLKVTMMTSFEASSVVGCTAAAL
jgi:hypothetical protein